MPCFPIGMSDLDAGAHDHADGGACGTCPPRLPFTLPAAEAPQGVKRKRNAAGMFECVEEGCGYHTARAGDLTVHIRTHSGEKPYACTEAGCGKRFATSGGRSAHIRTHSSERPYACTFAGCGNKFAKADHLAMHLRTHTREKPYACTVAGCGKSFSMSSHLTNHLRTHTKEKPYACMVKGCGQSFSQSGCLTSHVRAHSGEKPYACTFSGCGKSFTKSGDLTAHTRTHTKEKPYACTVAGCGKSFSMSGHLKNHLLIHAGEKPYACTVAGCGKNFAKSGDLKLHVRTHSGDKPYACDIEGCEYRCAAPFNLTIHMRTHTGEKPYACAFEGCDARFAHSDSQKKHFYYYHTAEGNAARHRDEEIIKNVLIENGFEFKREHQVDLKCALPGATFARGDFVLVFGDTVVFLEVDEDQHKSYGVSCDVRRMADIAASLRIEGNTMRIAFVRYNPHGFQVGGVTKPTKRKDRHARLVDVLSNLRRESTEAITESDVRVFYLFYDVDDDGVPSIFEDDEYDAQAKQWLASAIVN